MYDGCPRPSSSCPPPQLIVECQSTASRLLALPAGRAALEALGADSAAHRHLRIFLVGGGRVGGGGRMRGVGVGAAGVLPLPWFREWGKARSLYNCPARKRPHCYSCHMCVRVCIQPTTAATGQELALAAAPDPQQQHQQLLLPGSSGSGGSGGSSEAADEGLWRVSAAGGGWEGWLRRVTPVLLRRAADDCLRLTAGLVSRGRFWSGGAHLLL